MIEFLRSDASTRRLRTEKGGKERVKQLITIKGSTPADLLDPRTPEPALEPWFGNRKVDIEGLQEIRDEEEEEGEAEELQVGRAEGDEEEEDEMLLEAEPGPSRAGPSSKTRSSTTWGAPPKYNISNIKHKLSESSQVQQSQASDISHVSETTVGEKRQRSSPGEQQAKRKGRFQPSNEDDESMETSSE